jgi:hypothetical protein
MTDEFSVSLGDVVMDKDTNTSGPVVVSRISAAAADWHVPGRGTLAEDNPDYPADDRVICSDSISSITQSQLDESTIDEHDRGAVPWSAMNGSEK